MQDEEFGHLQEENDRLRLEVARLANGSQRLLARERSFWNALECASDVILCVDQAGVISYVNSAVERVFGIAPQSLLGHSASTLLAGGGTDLLLLLQRRLRSERGRDGLPIETTAKHANGNTIHVEISFGEMTNVDGSIGFTVVLRDVSQRRRAEQLARERLNELEHLQRVHTVDVLATSLAHELNQPLVALCLQADFASSLVNEGEFTPELGEALNEIAEQAQRASRVISSLRRLAAKGDDQRTRISLDALVKNTLALCNATARDRGVKLSYRPPLHASEVEVSSVQLEQVLLNLIQNAIESIESVGHPQGEVGIHVRRADGGFVELVVTDNGAGFRDDSERLFESFYTTKASGMGLGLAICRKIIEDHQGKITAAPLTDGGAEFRITLPALPAREAARV